jgi:hypothetical protein
LLFAAFCLLSLSNLNSNNLSVTQRFFSMNTPDLMSMDHIKASSASFLCHFRGIFGLSLAGLVSLLLIVGQGEFARAATPVVDQQTLVPQQAAIAVFANWSYGQSFTVGRAGSLTRLDFQLGRVGGNVQPLQVALRTANGDLPNLDESALLFSGTIAASDVPILSYASSHTVSINLSSLSPVMVSPGDKLVVVLSSSDPNWYYWDNSGYFNSNPYPNGSAVQSTPSTAGWAPMDNWDFGFRTWVTPVPEPVALVPLGVVLLLLGHRFTRR